MGYRQTVVASDSMFPLLATGDVVLLQAQPTYEVGDIIQFERSGLLYLHRIVKETADGYETRGDANPVPDLQYVKLNHIQGKALGVFRKLGTPLTYLRGMLTHFHSNASFNSSTRVDSKALSRYWQNPTVLWTVMIGEFDIAFSSPNGVSFLDSGLRVIQSPVLTSGLVRIYMEGRLTGRDSLGAGFLFTTHACQSILGRPTCGWSFHFDDTNQRVTLRAHNSNGSLSKVLASATYSNSLSTLHKYILEVSPSLIVVTLNSEILLQISHPNNLASNNGVQIPTGTRIRFEINGYNRFNANKLVVW